MAVEGGERDLQLGRDGAWVELAGFAGAGLGHLAANMSPEVAERQRLRVRPTLEISVVSRRRKAW